MQISHSISSFIATLAASFLIASPATAALVTFNYDAEITGYHHSPDAAVSEAVFSSIYTNGTLASVSLSIDYDGNLDNLVMTAFEISIAGDYYSMTMTSNQTVIVQNNATLASLDSIHIITPQISGTSQGAVNPNQMEFYAADNSPTNDQLFSSNVPTLLEIVSIASPPPQDVGAFIQFEDFDGYYVGRYVLRNNGRPISVSVEDERLSEVPLPASFPLMLSGCIGVGALLARRRSGC